jgi:hypothetical protein
MSTFARNVSALRDTRPRAPRPCVGCALTVLTADSWALCPSCTEQARSVISARTYGLAGAERREIRNRFWGSQQAVSEALAELRVGVAG